MEKSTSPVLHEIANNSTVDEDEHSFRGSNKQSPAHVLARTPPPFVFFGETASAGVFGMSSPSTTVHRNPPSIALPVKMHVEDIDSPIPSQPRRTGGAVTQLNAVSCCPQPPCEGPRPPSAHARRHSNSFPLFTTTSLRALPINSTCEDVQPVDPATAQTARPPSRGSVVPTRSRRPAQQPASAPIVSSNRPVSRQKLPQSSLDLDSSTVMRSSRGGPRLIVAPTSIPAAGFSLLPPLQRSSRTREAQLLTTADEFDLDDPFPMARRPHRQRVHDVPIIEYQQEAATSTIVTSTAILESSVVLVPSNSLVTRAREPSPTTSKHSGEARRTPRQRQRPRLQRQQRHQTNAWGE